MLATALDEPLHDGCSSSCLAALHTTMRFIDNKIQPVRFFFGRIFNRLPNRVLSGIGMFPQVTCIAQLLCVQEIDATIIKGFLIKTLI